MELYGLVGRVLGHSFSAQYFNERFSKEGRDARYVNFEIPSVEGHFKEIIERHPTLLGLNVTIPYKEDVIPFLDDISDDARAIGAVNVIRVSRDGGNVRLKGYNSDVIGFRDSLVPLLHSGVKKALVLGTGGASKAVVYALKTLGIQPTYVSRTPAEERLTYDALTPEVMEENLLVVNCTPLGMFPKVDASPDIPYDCITPRHLLYDLVYNPEETLFLKRGREKGAVVKNGLEMLRLQAVAGWNFWHEE